LHETESPQERLCELNSARGRRLEPLPNGAVLTEPLRLSVVIPTHGRPDRLKASLAALERQTAVESIEIVVVDDGSPQPDAVARVVEGTGARLIRRPEAGGVAAARNEGVRAAHEPFVCFTDDDCEAAPEWARRMLRAFDSGADAVTGTTLNGCPDNPFDTVSQLISNYLAERALGPPPTTSFGLGSNLGAKTDLLRVLPFDERYRGAAEERDWCQNVTEHGYRFVAVPDAVVVHKQHLDLRRFWTKHVHYGRGAFTYRRLATSPRPFESPGFYVGMMVRAFKAGPLIGFLFCLAEIATAAGVVREWLAQLAFSGPFRRRRSSDREGSRS
jgi:GT2 family glycosyltransferase